MADGKNNGESSQPKEDHKKEDVPLPAKEDHKKEDEPPHPIENVVLVGRTGNGKSATANSIARQKVFKSRTSAAGVTMECQTFRVLTPNGPILNLIDTPGLLDMSVSADFISKEIVKCLTLADGGLHAVLLVLSVRNRITKEEEMVLSTLQVLFGSMIVDYLIVVFTAGDVLEDDCITLDEYLGENCPDFLKRVLLFCGKRMILFDNKTKDDAKQAKQVHDLLTLIDLVRKQNNNKPYTNEMYHKIKEITERHQKEQEELESKGHLTDQLLEAMKELQLNYEKNLKAMAFSMEEALRAAKEANQHRYLQDEMDKYKTIAEMERNMQMQLASQRRSDCSIM